MALTTAERQARYIQRLKSPAETLVLAMIADLSFTDRAITSISVPMAVVPIPGDTIIIRDGAGEWTAEVKSRVLRSTDAVEPKIILHCDGRYRESDGHIGI